MAIGSALVGGLIAGGLGLAGASKQAGAARDAAAQSAQGTAMAIAEQRAAREQLVKLLSPWTTGGQGALARQMSFLGLGVNGAGQQQAINQFEQSPMFQSLARQGEDAILQNASATGGLRGGNVQGALAQFRPALLNQQLQQQFQNLGSISGLGQASAAGVGAGVQGAANNIGNLQMANASTQGNAGLVGANAYGQAFGQIGNLAGRLFGGGGISADTVARLTPGAASTIAANQSIF